jgi:putative FmdB family regulatory protein
MPIFEYVCSACREKFEALVLGSRTPACPKCHGTDLEKQLSAFAFRSAGGDAAASGGSKCSGCAGGSCSTCH